MLISLVAYNDINKRIPRHCVHEYKRWEEKKLTEPIDLERIADKVTPEYVVFTLVNPEATVDELRPTLSKLNLKMFFGKSDIYRQSVYFTFGLLADLEEPHIVDGKLYLNLQFASLFGELMLIGLAKHVISFELWAGYKEPDYNYKCGRVPLESFEEHFSSYGIMGKLTFLDTPERKELYNKNFEHVIQIPHYTHALPPKLKETTDRFFVRLNWNNPTKGFFFQCENVDLICKVDLSLNGPHGFSYDRFLIRSKCKRINRRLLYLPFNFEKTWSDINASSYEGSVNLSRIDKVFVTITLDKPIECIRIYGLAMNVYRQLEQMGDVVYGHDSLCETEFSEEELIE
jgi:hypothetical protein